MRSIKFPKMFNTNNTNVWTNKEYLEATKQNTSLLLQCEKGELLGDPYFGIMLKQFMFDQNNVVLRDAIIDMFYNQIALFVPQLKVNRKDIHIIQNLEKGKVYCTISGINQIDFKNDTISLLLFENSDNV